MSYADIYPALATPSSKSPSIRSGKMSHHSVDALTDKEGNGSRIASADTASGSTAHGGHTGSGKGQWLLLLIFSLSQFLDLCGRASAIAFVHDVSRDLSIDYEASTWILNSYGVTFGSFLLLWGRVSDLYSAKPVFSLGFLFSGAFSLATSFMTEGYSFYVMRALHGIAAAATIPSAFRLILAVFPPGEVQIALALFGLSAALANAVGLIVGGAFGEISTTGQMANWRWFFRFITLTSIPFALLAHFLCPNTSSTIHQHRISKWKLLDIPGSVLILAALMLLNVGLTLGASEGFDTASFLVPTILAFPLAVAFFFWEKRVGEEKALLPLSLFRVNNMVLMSFVACNLLATVAVVQLALVERYQLVAGETVIKASVRMLPQGLAMCLMVIIASPMIKKVVHLRLPISISFIIAGAAYIPWIYGDGTTGTGYWYWYVPGFVVGSMAFAIAYLGVNITMMTSVPASMAGVVGALFQVCCQTGSTTGFSIQAGLFTVHEGSIKNFKNIQISFWFQFGWCVLCGLLVLLLYRPRVIVSGEGKEAEEHQLEERRGGV